MKTILFCMLSVVLLSQCSPAMSSGFDLEQLKGLTERYPFAVLVDEDNESEMKFLYADIQQHVHIYHSDNGKLVMDWETTNLASRVVSLFVADLFGDGGKEFVIATEAGRILIYDLESYDLVWENLQDPFDKIECLAWANIDSDIQVELIFVADNYLHIYDSANHAMEWESQREFSAQEIIIANVDDDDQAEIILNTGAIIDSRFHNTEFELEKSFGEKIHLYDVNGDGIPEIFGEFSNFSLRIYDIYAEREIW